MGGVARRFDENAEQRQDTARYERIYPREIFTRARRTHGSKNSYITCYRIALEPRSQTQIKTVRLGSIYIARSSVVPTPAFARDRFILFSRTSGSFRYLLPLLKFSYTFGLLYSIWVLLPDFIILFVFFL